MRILLLYSNQSRELVPAPPVGLSYVASAARAAGHEVTLVDLAFSARPEQELAQAIDRSAPELVGMSIRNLDNIVAQRYESPRQALLAQVAVIRRHAVDARGQPVPLVLGGPAVSILGARALDTFGADYAIVGEGEEAFPALLAALGAGLPVDGISGLCWRQDGVARHNPHRPLAHFGASGLQHWVDWAGYQSHGGTWPIQTKRGCAMRCSYCAYPLVEGSRVRLREPAEVVDEIERVARGPAPRGQARTRTFEFVDSTFNVPSAHAIAICEEILRRRLKVHLTAMGFNPRDVPPELLPLMKRAGFNSVMVTPEAASETMLRHYRKGFKMAEIENTLQQVRASGLKSMWFFMLGAPGETMDSCRETIAFARDRLTGRRFLSVLFTGVRVLPGTELARQAVDLGHLAADVDLTEGIFYLSPQLDERGVIDLINAAIARNPCIVHAAEGGVSKTQQTFFRALQRLGVAPPYWRYLPEVLSLPLLHRLRVRNPSVQASRQPGGVGVQA